VRDVLVKGVQDLPGKRWGSSEKAKKKTSVRRRVQEGKPWGGGLRRLSGSAGPVDHGLGVARSTTLPIDASLLAPTSTAELGTDRKAGRKGGKKKGGHVGTIAGNVKSMRGNAKTLKKTARKEIIAYPQS